MMQMISKFIPKNNYTKEDLEKEKIKKAKKGLSVSTITTPIQKPNPYKKPNVRVQINDDKTFHVSTYDPTNNLDPVSISYTFDKVDNSIYFQEYEEHFSTKKYKTKLAKLKLDFMRTNSTLEIMVSDDKDIYVRDTTRYPNQELLLVNTDLASYNNTTLSLRDGQELAEEYMNIFNEYKTKLGISKIEKQVYKK